MAIYNGDYRIAMRLDFVDDSLQDTAETLSIGDFFIEHEPLVSSLLDSSEKRLLFIKSRYGGKVVASTEMTEVLKSFIDKYIEVNTLDTTHYHPKLTFLVKFDSGRGNFTFGNQNVQEFQEEIMNNFTKYEPYILRIRRDGVEHVLIPFQNANTVFTTMSLVANETPRTLMNLIIQFIEYMYNNKINILQDYYKWYNDTCKAIDGIGMVDSKQDYELGYIARDLSKIDAVMQLMSAWIEDANANWGTDKPFKYTINTGGITTNNLVAIKLASSNSGDIPVIDVYIRGSNSSIAVNAQASLQINRLGQVLGAQGTWLQYNELGIVHNASWGAETSQWDADGTTALASTQATLWVRGGRTYDVYANTRFLTVTAVTSRAISAPALYRAYKTDVSPTRVLYRGMHMPSSGSFQNYATKSSYRYLPGLTVSGGSPSYFVNGPGGQPWVAEFYNSNTKFRVRNTITGAVGLDVNVGTAHSENKIVLQDVNFTNSKYVYLSSTKPSYTTLAVYDSYLNKTWYGTRKTSYILNATGGQTVFLNQSWGADVSPGNRVYTNAPVVIANFPLIDSETGMDLITQAGQNAGVEVFLRANIAAGAYIDPSECRGRLSYAVLVNVSSQHESYSYYEWR